MIKKTLILNLLFSGTLMVNAAKEIELKFSLPVERYEAVEHWMKENALYKGESEQEEWYLARLDHAWDYSLGFKDTMDTLRVRREKKGDSFCCKKAHLDAVTKKITHRDELETKIADGLILLQALKVMGYTDQTLVQKVRKTYVVRDTFEVVFDSVKGIGKFIEVELKKPVDDVKEGMTQIEKLLKEIGITELTVYGRSYIHMIWNPKYEFGEKRTL